MTQIIGIAGKKQSGKTTASNYIHGYLMKQNLVVEDFRINDEGKLVISALFKTDDGYKKDMGVLDLDQKTPEFEGYAASRIWPIVKGYSFADPLKEVCIGLLGLTYEQCYGTNEQKNSLTELRWEDMPGFIAVKDWSILEGRLNPSIMSYPEDFNLVTKEGFMTAREVLQYVGTQLFRRMRRNVWVDTALNQVEVDQPEVAVIPDCRYLNEVKAIQEKGGLVVRLLRNPYNDNHSSETELDNYDGFDYVIDNRNMTIQECNLALLEFLLDERVVKPMNLG